MNILAAIAITHILVDKWNWFTCRFCVGFMSGFLLTLSTKDLASPEFIITPMNDIRESLIIGLSTGFLAFVVGTLTDYLQSNSAIE